MEAARPSTRLGFEIAIICALTLEADAVEALFDNYWDDENGPCYDKAPDDPNAYSTGSIGRHNVVLAYMPGMGKASSAAVAANCRASFPNVKLALVVGICGAVPFIPGSNIEVVLGDVIISSGIIEYDLGRQLPERFIRKSTLLESLGRPNIEIRALLAKLQGLRGQAVLKRKMAKYLNQLQDVPALEANYPGVAHDKLFHAAYRHMSDGKTCEECGCNGGLMLRRRFDQGVPQPAVHFGVMASGDTVMKSGKERDDIARRESVIGFEMEGAGVWDTFPCIVIKGACDYADSHKTKAWQRYAAATTAACTKAFLEYWVPSMTTGHVREQPTSPGQVLQSDLDAIETFFKSMSTFSANLRNRLLYHQPDNSLDWVIHTSAYHSWSRNMFNNSAVLWCKSDKASPKTTNMPIALGHLLLQQGLSIIHITKETPHLPDLSLARCPPCSEHLHCNGRPPCTQASQPKCRHPRCTERPHPHCLDRPRCTRRDVSAQFSLLQQAYMISPVAGSFSSFVRRSDILSRDPEDAFETHLRKRVVKVFRKLLDQDGDRRWVLLVHDASSLHMATRMALAGLVEKLLKGPSEESVKNLKVAIIGDEPEMMASIAYDSLVIDKNTEYRECLAGLKFDNMDNRRGRITTATVGTNHWIWQNPSYLGWQDETSSVIWIAGKPGSGKSVLAKTIQEQLLTTSGSARSLIAAWFYSARDNLVLHQQMFSALMQQLLSQEPSLFEYVEDVYRSLLQRYMTYREISWPVASLKRGMESMLPNLAENGASCLFIVDGLDESNSADAGQDCSRADALDFLVHLTTQGLPLKIIFLSRFSNDINRCLRNQHYISMHDVNRPDIVFLIERGVEDLSRKLDGDESDVDDDYSPMITPTMSTSSSFISDPATRKRQVSFFQEYSKQVSSEKESMILDIKAYLRANANGVVLWVVTVMDILRRKCEEPFCDLKSLKAQLESLPLELTELYSRIAVLLLQNFKGSRSTLEKSRRILMWVSVSSQYNFQLQDLLEVISSDLSSDEAVERPHVLAGRTGWSSVRRQIEKLCAAFVEVIPALPRTYDAADSEPTQWDILQLAHESVRTFLQHDENSLGLGFTQSEAERVVRQERRNYMRRTLPRLEPIFHLPTFQPSTGTGIEQELCSYIEIRPVLCFILSTLEFELQHIMSRPNGQDRVVNIVNECKPKNKQEMESRPVRLPFSPASALLAACDFLQLSKPKNPQLSLADVAYFVDNATFLGQLFFVACAGGQLNAANVLSLLLISPTAGMPEEIIIMDAMRRAAREEELLQEVRFLRSGRDCVYCCPNEMRGRIRKPDRAAAAISQVYRHLKFEGTSVRFRSLDGGNADYSLWTESPHWYRKLHALSKDKGNYHRTPFTRLFWTGPNGGFLLRFEGDNDIS